MHHFGVYAEFLAELNCDAFILRGIGIEHRRDIVLHMPRGEQHARHGEDTRDALIPQLVETIADNRRGEFQITILDRRIGHEFAQAIRNAGELCYGALIAAAMAAHHDASFFAHGLAL